MTPSDPSTAHFGKPRWRELLLQRRETLAATTGTRKDSGVAASAGRSTSRTGSWLRSRWKSTEALRAKCKWGSLSYIATTWERDTAGDESIGTSTQARTSDTGAPEDRERMTSALGSPWHFTSSLMDLGRSEGFMGTAAGVTMAQKRIPQGIMVGVSVAAAMYIMYRVGVRRRWWRQSPGIPHKGRMERRDDANGKVSRDEGVSGEDIRSKYGEEVDGASERDRGARSQAEAATPSPSPAVDVRIGDHGGIDDLLEDDGWENTSLSSRSSASMASAGNGVHSNAPAGLNADEASSRAPSPDSAPEVRNLDGISDASPEGANDEGSFGVGKSSFNFGEGIGKFAGEVDIASLSKVVEDSSLPDDVPERFRARDESSTSESSTLLAEADDLIAATADTPKPARFRELTGEEIDALVTFTNRVLARDPVALTEIVEDDKHSEGTFSLDESAEQSSPARKAVRSVGKGDALTTDESVTIRRTC